MNNYLEAKKMFEKGQKESPDPSVNMSYSYGAIVMFGIFLDEIEKGNLIIKENK